MPIWTQEQLYELVKTNHLTLIQGEGKIPSDQWQNGLKTTLQMEQWLDAPLRDQLDKELGRVDV